jgi:hypothetical protein
MLSWPTWNVNILWRKYGQIMCIEGVSGWVLQLYTGAAQKVVANRERALDRLR